MSDNYTNANFQRDQLYAIFKSHDLVRAFEALVRQATETTPAQNNSTDEQIYSVSLSGLQAASQTRTALNEIDQQQQRRYVDTTALQNQINDIKAFIGMT